MFGFDKIEVSLSFSWVIFILLILVALAYSFFVYRFTLPPVSEIKRFTLAFLRFLALSILILVFFEPVLSLEKKVKVEPLNLVFVDDSKSMRINDGTQRIEKTLSLIDKLKSSDLKNNVMFYSFASDVKQIDADKITDELKFDKTSTNFNKIFNSDLLKDKNVASLTIISDGVITEGSSPVYAAEKFGIPVISVAVGDSSKKKDIAIRNVLFNEYVYAETPTSISATITNNGFEGQSISASLFEGNSLIEQQQIILDESGVNSANFTYTAQQSGEKKLSIRINNLSGESSAANNVYPFFLNVRSNKIKVLLLSGSPSPDLSFIKNALQKEKNFQVNTLTQVSSSNFLEINPNQKIDSADVIFLLSFPTKETSQEIFNRVKEKILNKNTPFFLMLNNSTDISKLSQISNELPLTIQNIRGDFLNAQPDLNTDELNNPIISTNINLNDWNNLPPVLYTSGNILPKTESKVLSYLKVDNNRLKQPLIVSRNFASKRSVCFVGKDFWKWKLQTAPKNIQLYDNLIINIAKWLSVTDEQKQFNVRTLRKFYSAGDDVEFFAELYDESLNPINDAEINIKIKSTTDETELSLTSIGNGLYEGKIKLLKSGDYNYSAEAKLNGKLYKKESGRFNVGDIDIEMIETRMNFELLNDLSLRTGGSLFFPDDSDFIINKIRESIKKVSDNKVVESQFRLWSNQWMLVIVILLFSLEWFIRKQSGML
ncbi:MAG: vWA domain-containing protein [Ignavibacterium sp.]|uniref:vWA domain-containing protein n=1 Tax=Ignavibacterium sp. TaxID=2651167 RepID=UPI00404953A1